MAGANDPHGNDFGNDFPIPDLDDWRRVAAESLGGRSPDELSRDTREGFSMPPLSTRTELAELPHVASGAVGLLRTQHRWRIRELIAHGDPEVAALHAREALTGGADEVELALDALAQDALDPEPFPEDGDDETQLAWIPPGEGGVALYDFDDLELCLRDVDLENTRVSFSGGEATLPLLAFLVLLADRRDLDRQVLSGDLDLDPVARMTTRQLAVLDGEPDDGARFVSQRSSIPHVFDEAAAIVRFCATECPRVRPLVIDGQGYHLGGGTIVQEIACTLAGAVETGRRLGERGVGFDRVVAAVTLRTQVAHELLLEVAKLRALRLLWVKVATSFGAPVTDAVRVPLNAVTSFRSRAHEYDLRANLLRTAIAGFAAVLGGCDSLTVVPFDDAPLRQDATARALARNQQLLLREESHLDRVADPLGGSYAVETLTHRIAAAAWQLLTRIEQQGGLFAAMQSGWLATQFRDSAEGRAADARHLRRALVGVSRFADSRLGGAARHGEELEHDTDEQVERLLARADAHRLRRKQIAVDDALERLHAAGAGTDAVVPAAVAAAGAGATVAEIAQATWPDEDTSFRHAFLLVASGDAFEFEELRAEVEHRLADPDGQAEVMLVPIGDPARVHAAADFARDLLQVGGFRAVDAGRFAGVDDARAAIVEAAPAAIVVCGEGDASATLDVLLRGLEPLPNVVVAGPPPESPDPRVLCHLHPGVDAIGALATIGRAILGLDLEG